jgi:hypothetical protein
MAKTDAPPPRVEPDTDEVSFEVEGRGWVVRVLGRAGGSARGATPLLLLGFWEAGSSDGDPARETLTVGTTLSELSVSGLEQAFSKSRPHFPEKGRTGRSTDTSEQRR